MMTIPFNVAGTILAALGQKRDAMRLVALEEIPAAEVTVAEKRNRGKLAFSPRDDLRRCLRAILFDAGKTKFL